MVWIVGSVQDVSLDDSLPIRPGCHQRTRVLAYIDAGI